MKRLDAGLLEPGLEVASDELRSVVLAKVFRLSVFEEQGIESVQDLSMAHLGGNDDTQGLARVLIKDGEHLIATATAQFVVDEVNAPDVVRMLRPQSNAGAVLVIEPFTSLVAIRQLQTFSRHSRSTFL